MKNDARNALIIFLINVLKCRRVEASYLIKQASKSFGECKKNTCRTKKEVFTQILVLGTQTKILHVESESQIDTDKRLGVITTSDELLSQT